MIKLVPIALSLAFASIIGCDNDGSSTTPDKETPEG